jgi:hypothetical protein
VGAGFSRDSPVHMQRLELPSAARTFAESNEALALMAHAEAPATA